MDEKQEQFAQVRLEVLVNGKRRAMLGIEPGESVFVGVTHAHAQGRDEPRTDLMMFGKPKDTEHEWRRGTALSGVGDEVVIRLVGPGPYEEPTTFFPLPSKPSSKEP